MTTTSASSRSPWWAIVRPTLCGENIKAGPFFSRESAQLELDENPTAYGNCKVRVFSGDASAEWRDFWAKRNA